MGTGYYYANIDAREWFSPRELGDNDKLPVDASAMALFELLKDRWAGARIRVYADSGDLPWVLERELRSYSAGLGFRWPPGTPGQWEDITDEVRTLCAGHAWGATFPGGDYQTAQYVNLRVCDDRGFPVRGDKHTELLARCIEAIKKVEPVP